MIKPVAYATEKVMRLQNGECATLSATALPSEGCNVELYAIQETHRIVSVELLEMILKFAEDATEHYSFMNDEVCQSYSDSWRQVLNVCRELRAAIDNK